jgi:hypothetical protein
MQRTVIPFTFLSEIAARKIENTSRGSRSSFVFYFENIGPPRWDEHYRVGGRRRNRLVGDEMPIRRPEAHPHLGTGRSAARQASDQPPDSPPPDHCDQCASPLTNL